MASRTELLRELFEPSVEAMGFELWGIEFLRQGRHALLRLYLDKQGGIDVEDCAEVSRQISSILDVEDPISGEYTLEVSSPGLERPLFTEDQFASYIGEELKVRLRQGVAKRRNFAGRLQSVEGGAIRLLVDGEEHELALDQVEKANLICPL